MTTIVIGGHSRKVGKTSLTAALIKALDSYSWTAAKISSHWHEDPPEGTSCVIHEEQTAGDTSDSARFLAAGAARSYWIRVREEQIERSFTALRPILQASPFVIIEGNCILRLIQPDLFIMVLKADVKDFKESARGILRRANAVVLVEGGPVSPSWMEFVRGQLTGIPVFATSEAAVLPPGLLELVRSRLRPQN